MAHNNSTFIPFECTTEWNCEMSSHMENWTQGAATNHRERDASL